MIRRVEMLPPLTEMGGEWVAKVTFSVSREKFKRRFTGRSMSEVDAKVKKFETNLANCCMIPHRLRHDGHLGAARS